MQNWFIAAFEAAGIWTHEQAEHVSKEIRLHIHKENYREAIQELQSILSKHKEVHVSAVHKLEARVAELEALVASLKDKKSETLAKPKKV